ncbi:Uncharacterised protein [Weissella viridescens]|uniref:Uncharacterized protein n=1 Tax=Weissella viridescens TaxID=1629 RepID=A0A380NXQ1_WEIVI|nr:Uncharacterised protein [Weissella viridescens]
MSAEAQALLALRGAFAFDLTDTEALALDLRYYAFIGGMDIAQMRLIYERVLL